MNPLLPPPENRYQGNFPERFVTEGIYHSDQEVISSAGGKMNLPSWVVKNFHFLWTLAGSFHARCSWSTQRRKAPALGIPIVLLVMFSLLIPRYAMGQTSGKVVDLFTDLPIEGALVTLDNDVEPTDRDGIFQMKTEGYKVAVRAQGYLRTEQVLTGSHEIKLMPFTPRALYLSFYGIGETPAKLRTQAHRGDGAQCPCHRCQGG